jgi:hypothetical protein
MRSIQIACVALAALLLLPAVGAGDPPDHAPAHGRRDKGQQSTKHQQPSGGLEVVFDSNQGVHIAIGLPGVYFHSGHYYRHNDAGWQVSASGKGGWSVAVVHSVPDLIRKKHTGPPAKAKSHSRNKHEGGKKRK